MTVACRSISASPSRAADLEEAREQWDREGPASYGLRYVRGGNWVEGEEPSRVVVRGGIPVSFRQRGGPDSVEGAERRGFPLTIEDLFEGVASSLDADAFDIEYDETFGYPVRMSIELDTSPNSYDDAYGFTVIAFEPLDG